MARTLTLMVALGLTASGLALTDEKAPSEEKLAQKLRMASGNNKYRMLLRQIKVAEDKESYGDFNDYGLYSSTEYGNYKDLPRGYWVYAEPYWYIWRDMVSERKPNRDWGPEQAI